MTLLWNSDVVSKLSGQKWNSFIVPPACIKKVVLTFSLFFLSWNETSLRLDQRIIEKYFVEGNSSLKFTHDIFITFLLCVCVCVCVFMYVCMYVCMNVCGYV